MRNIFCLVLVAASLVACSSKPKNTQSKPIEVPEVTLQLNGSSDESRAGGLRTVPFDYNSDDLSKFAKSIMDQNVKFLTENPKINIQIEGHCDEMGSAQYNLALGERRAKVVRDYLRAKGIQVRRMATISYGKERPLDEGNSESSRSKNRRANFVVTLM